MKRTHRSLMVAVLMAILVPGLAAWAEHRGPLVEIPDARLKIEVNDTDGDAGIQVFIDADPWKRMEIFNPRGRKLFGAKMRGKFGKQGGAELFMESGEPSFDEVSFEEFLERFPEGEYQFRGRGVEGEHFFGTAQLTHDVPDGPSLISPIEGELVDTDDVVVRWEAVDPPNGSPIIAYQVIVELSDSPFAAIPKIVLDVMMPASATEMTVPGGFLLPDNEYEWEVLSIEESGNQTLFSSFFHTAP